MMMGVLYGSPPPLFSPCSCSGTEYVVIDASSCACTTAAYALCDGTSYSACACDVPQGWVEVVAPGSQCDAGDDAGEDREAGDAGIDGAASKEGGK
jgi:hypothetical protein